MGRKHKFVNKTHYPDWAIERFTRCIFDDVIEFFSTEAGQAEYEAWEREQAELKNKKRAALLAALFLFIGPFSSLALSVWILAVWVRHWGNRLVRIS